MHTHHIRRGVALAALLAAGAAGAQEAGDWERFGPPMATSDLTRAEVVAQVIDARRQGWRPSGEASSFDAETMAGGTMVARASRTRSAVVTEEREPRLAPVIDMAPTPQPAADGQVAAMSSGTGSAPAGDATLATTSPVATPPAEPPQTPGTPQDTPAPIAPARELVIAPPPERSESGTGTASDGTATGATGSDATAAGSTSAEGASAEGAGTGVSTQPVQPPPDVPANDLPPRQ